MAIALGSVVLGCGPDPGAFPRLSHEPDCVDRDSDGFGDGCALGPDCDDDENVTNECRAGSPAGISAEAGPTCTEGARLECVYPVDVDGPGPPLCTPGERWCEGGSWGPCEPIEGAWDHPAGQAGQPDDDDT